jgi:hypothetical protein
MVGTYILELNGAEAQAVRERICPGAIGRQEDGLSEFTPPAIINYSAVTKNICAR